MSVRIRLRRVGRKKQPYYRVVVMDADAPRDGAYIDAVGFYNPRTRPAHLTLDLEKVDAWLAKGAQATVTAESLIRKARKGGDKKVRLIEPDAPAPAPTTAAMPEQRPTDEPAGESPPPLQGEPTDPLRGAAPDAEKEPPAGTTQGETKQAVDALAPVSGVAATTGAPVEETERPSSAGGEGAPEPAEAESAEAESAEAESAEAPAAQAPAAEEPVAEEPVAEEPVAEEPVAEEPVAEEPVAEASAAEEPAAEAPAAEEPAAEAPVEEEPASEEPVAEESAERKPGQGEVDEA
jgi:ribosomal protein S16